MGTKYHVAVCDPPVVCHDGAKMTRTAAKAEALARYFTGEPCKYGHIDERYTSSTMCLRCERERHRSEAYHKWAADYQRSYIPEPTRRHNSKWQRVREVA